MIALLKYGSGLPFNRLEHLQESLGMPLPASTQWEIVEKTAAVVKPAFQELIRQAAQGEVVYNDDTTMKILTREWEKVPRASNQQSNPRRRARNAPGSLPQASCQPARGAPSRCSSPGAVMPERTWPRCSRSGPRIWVHRSRCATRSRAISAGHSQPSSPAEVYQNDARCREQHLAPEARLRFHQTHSGPLLKTLENWLAEQFAQRKVEPNCGLGQAITYMRKHWQALTLFLRKAGAPLDNNVCERALKKAILHRKNALFYKTPNGAHVGDTFMSLIHSCGLVGANAFDYLTALQQHSRELASNPDEWMPWNYRHTLDLGATRDAAH